MVNNVHDDESNNLAAVNIKLPPFWSNSPATWFMQAEAQFSLNRINSDINRYNYVITSLPQDVAEAITDILQDPPTNNMYNSLKKVLIERHSLSLERRIKKIISDEEMGDKRPSEFFRTLRQLAGTCGTVGEDLLRKLWMGRLPHLINIALIPQKDEQINTLLEVADQVWEAMQISNVSTVDRSSTSNFSRSKDFLFSSDDRMTNLEKQIFELNNKLSNFNLHQSRSRSRSRNMSFSDSSLNRDNHKRFNRNSRLCWYHYKFGDRAQKCIAPCAKNKNPFYGSYNNSFESNQSN